MEQIQQDYHTDVKKVYCNKWKELELLILLAFVAVGGKETPPLGEKQEENCECQEARAGQSATHYRWKSFCLIHSKIVRTVFKCSFG